jgi:hypothetical protein
VKFSSSIHQVMGETFKSSFHSGFSEIICITSNRSFTLPKTAERTCSLGIAVGFMAGILSACEPGRMFIILEIVSSSEKGSEGFFITRLVDRRAIDHVTV